MIRITLCTAQTLEDMLNDPRYTVRKWMPATVEDLVKFYVEYSEDGD